MPYRELLGSLSLTARAQPAAVDQLAAAAHTRRFARGQILFVEGEPSEHLLVVVSGRVKIVVRSPQGDSLVLVVLGPGDTLGELSILDGGPRSAGAEAVDPAEIAAVPVAAVLEFLRSEPDAMLGVARELAATVRRLTGSTADMVFLDLPRRVAKLLLDSVTPPATVVHLGLSQTEIAAQLGTTRQSVNRALGQLQRRGWIHTVPEGDITIVNRPALQQYTDS